MFVGHLGSFGVGEVKFSRYRSGWGRECKGWGVKVEIGEAGSVFFERFHSFLVPGMTMCEMEMHMSFEFSSTSPSPDASMSVRQTGRGWFESSTQFSGVDVRFAHPVPCNS